MSSRTEREILSFTLTSGYVFKNFTQFIHSVRSEQVITFTKDEIICENVTTRGNVCGRAVMYASEIGLAWDEEIPIKNRFLSLNFSKNNLTHSIPKIKKKDGASITIHQIIDEELEDDNPNYIMYFSKSLNQDNHQSVERIPYTRSLEDSINVDKKIPNPAKSLTIPIHQFARIVERFREKKSKTVVTIYSENNKNMGINFRSTIYGHGNEILEFFGELSDDFDKSCEFEINYLDACILYNMSQMHREGSVHISYEKDKDLLFCSKFGAFGHTEVYLNSGKIDDET